MGRFIFGIFIIMHGLVHMWYVALNQKWVEFKPDMAWTGKSWLLSGGVSEEVLRPVATILFVLSMLGFLVGGTGILLQINGWRSILLGTSILSLVTILVFWDGSGEMVVQKGLLGLLINVGIILYILLTRS
jgi:hypothetical protein